MQTLERDHAEAERLPETPTPSAPTDPTPPAWRDGLLRPLLAALCLLFFQAYMVAPLIPYLSEQFHTSRENAGMLVPAYLLPYAVGTFTWGLLADRIGRRNVIFTCLPLFAISCTLCATAPSFEGLFIWRVITGLTGGGIAVLTLTLAGDLFPVSERGRALGWIFGAIAGGSAFGSTLGGMLTPLIGWRGLFLGVGLFSALPVLALLPYWSRLAPPPNRAKPESFGTMLRGYWGLLQMTRGRNTYLYVFLNGVFHSGTFTWLGAYLVDRYQLNEMQIGLALLGYGIPGFLGGPLIGKWVDRVGRARLLPWGLALGAAAGALLIPPISLPLAVIATTALSLGLDMSHPLLSGIVTSLAPERRGQAMGLNGFILFLGLSLGSLFFGWGMQRWGFAAAMGVFVVVQLGLAIFSVRLFRGEVAVTTPSTPR
jgi:predicted MFS family arabinose efflux permease